MNMLFPPAPRDRAEFDRAIPDEARATEIFMEVRWPDGVCCGDCGSHDMCKLSRDGWWQCRPCRTQTSIRSGTVLHRTRKPLRDWLLMLWRCSTLAGQSARAIARELGYRYETLWIMVHKLRAALASRGWQLAGPAELAVADVPAPKPAKGDPPEGRRVPVPVAIGVAEDRHATDLVRFSVAAPGQTDAALLERARWEQVEPGAEVKVVPRRLTGPTNRVGAEMNFTHRSLRRWLSRVFRGVSKRYLANYLAQFAYTSDRWRSEDQLFGFMIRRVMHEPWRSRKSMILSAP